MTKALTAITLILITSCSDTSHERVKQNPNESKAHQANANNKYLNDVGCNKNLTREEYLNCSITNLKEINKHE